MRVLKRRILLLLLIAGLLVRSQNFGAHLNFSAEQASFSIKAMELWQNKEIEVLGPPISFRFQGRTLFQGSVTYYFQMLFLLMGNWDPVKSSYLLAVFGVIMAVPLYLAISMVAGVKLAVLGSGIYLLLPLLVDYSRFFWNPNFQLILTPLFLWLLAKYYQNRLVAWLFGSGVAGGVLLMFHYQYLIVLIMASVWLFLAGKVRTGLFWWFAGLLAGISPMLIFEIRNGFYNLKTLWLYINNFDQVMGGGGRMLTPHYYLSIILAAATGILMAFGRKLGWPAVGTVLACLLAVDFIRYIPYPAFGFGMAKDWHYQDEVLVNQIIKSQNRENFNIVNLEYDTLASVQKYLLKKDRVEIKGDDYRNNRYLFVVNRDEKYMENPAYEVNAFAPSKLISQWRINDSYKLFLLERER